MKSCMIAAGLVKGVVGGGSPHPLIVVLEPEAASFHCHKVMGEQILNIGDKLLVADIGGGTSDIVVQEVVSIGENFSYRVKEVTTSSGGLHGGTSVDANFKQFLQIRIGPSFPECILSLPCVYAQLLKAWESAKTNFGEPTMTGESIEIDFPTTLASEWQSYDRRMEIAPQGSYDGLEITYQELQSIFDPVVDEILTLISSQLIQSGSHLKVLVVVRGFADSPYLTDRIRSRFSTTIPHIFRPSNPGCAVSAGAVALALNPKTIVSRICKYTYEFAVRRRFETGVDPISYLETAVGGHPDGQARCNHRFEALVQKGEEVRVDDCVIMTCEANWTSKKTTFRIFSSQERDPRYVIGESVRKEGDFSLWDASGGEKLGIHRNMKMSLFFGGSCNEVKAEAVNFVATGQLGFPIQVDYS